MGLPVTTGDVLTSATVNGLVAFTLNAQSTTAYVPVLADEYQVLVTISNASANTYKIPTNASVAYPNGTVLNILNIGVGLCTISAVTPGTTTINSGGAVATSPTLAQYKSCVAIKTGTDVWYVVGAVA
jgi:hypothetical protein